MFAFQVPEKSARNVTKETAFIAEGARAFADEGAVTKLRAAYVAKIIRLYMADYTPKTEARAHYESARYGKVSASAVARAWQKISDTMHADFNACSQEAQKGWVKAKCIGAAAIGIFAACHEQDDVIRLVPEALRD